MGFGMVYDLGFTAFCMSFSLQPGIGEGCHVNGQQPPEFTRKVTSHPSESTSHPPMSSRSPWKLHEKCQENHQRFPKCQTVQQFPHRNPWNTSPIPIVPGMTDESDLRAALSEAIQLLEDLRSAAVTYVGGRRQQGWSEQLGLYFHVFGHNSVTLENNWGSLMWWFFFVGVGWFWLGIVEERWLVENADGCEL